MKKTTSSGVVSRAMPKFGIKTDPALVRRLEESAQRTLTKEEVRAQRISYVYGNMPQDSTVERTRIEAIIANIEGEAA